MSGGFNPFYDRYLSGSRGVKRKRDYSDDTIVSRPYKKMKYSIPSNSPALTNRIIKTIPGEMKGMDTDLSMTSIVGSTNSNANILVLNLIQQGNGSWNRVGRKTHLNSVRVKGAVTFTTQPILATGVANAPSVRWCLVWDKQPSGNAIPSFDTIFGITAQDGTESCPDVTCPLKYDNMDRFVLIKDSYLTAPCNPSFSIGSGPSISVNVGVDEYIKLNNLESVYSGQSNPMTIADISTGALYFVVRSQLVIASSITIDAVARVRYKD